MMMSIFTTQSHASCTNFTARKIRLGITINAKAKSNTVPTTCTPPARTPTTVEKEPTVAANFSVYFSSVKLR